MVTEDKMKLLTFEEISSVRESNITDAKIEKFMTKRAILKPFLQGSSREWQRSPRRTMLWIICYKKTWKISYEFICRSIVLEVNSANISQDPGFEGPVLKGCQWGGLGKVSGDHPPPVGYDCSVEIQKRAYGITNSFVYGFHTVKYWFSSSTVISLLYV